MNLLFNFKRKRQISTRGFTLVETIVSTMVITVVILGPLTVANNASTYARQTRDTMTSVYLAQEAIELLRHQQDSIYLRCIGLESSNCPLGNGETPREAAWRIFTEDRLAANTYGYSCYSDSSGCSYDFIDMASNMDLPPSKYSISSTECNTLSVGTNHDYVCTGAHGYSSGYTQTSFSRAIFITSRNVRNCL